MKYLRQFGIILAVSSIGELLNNFIPLPIPGSIYGIIIMLVLLITKVIKVSQVKEVSGFLIEIMPVMFIPAAAGLITSWGQFEPILIPVVVVIIVTTILVMGITGKVVDLFIKGDENEL